MSELTPEQRAFAERMEPLWRRAHRIAQERPELDVTDVFHALRNLQRTPAERLARALLLGRVVESKRAAGRRKDLAVLPALEAALAASEDRAEK